MEDDLVECAFHQMAKRINCVGFCKKHNCYLTITHLKNMYCLQKQCKHLVRLEHQYWIDRAELKRIRKKKNLHKKNLFIKEVEEKWFKN